MRNQLAIVDDDEKILISLKRFFTLKNFQVDTYNDPREAMTRIKASFHKVVLADINMPGMDGIELMTRLKKYNPLIQVVIMTGNSTPEAVRSAIMKGASGIVVKPFDSLQMLEREVEKAINNVAMAMNKKR